jgi:enamine deaminase RidA (YjgF/YER057c/UK114 family)
MTIQRIETGARMSKVVIHGDTVYLAGFTANKALAGGVAEQTVEILSIIDGYLAKAGTDKTNIWLSDIRTVDDINEVWDAWVPAGRLRARARLHRGAAARAGEEGGDSDHGGEVTAYELLHRADEARNRMNGHRN